MPKHRSSQPDVDSQGSAQTKVGQPAQTRQFLHVFEITRDGRVTERSAVESPGWVSIDELSRYIHEWLNNNEPRVYGPMIITGRVAFPGGSVPEEARPLLQEAVHHLCWRLLWQGVGSELVGTTELERVGILTITGSRELDKFQPVGNPESAGTQSSLTTPSLTGEALSSPAGGGGRESHPPAGGDPLSRTPTMPETPQERASAPIDEAALLRVANRYCLFHYSHHFQAKAPHRLSVAAESTNERDEGRWIDQQTTLWICSVVLTSPAYGVVGKVGEVVVDARAATVLGATPRSEVLAAAERLREEHKDAIQAAFLRARSG